MTETGQVAYVGAVMRGISSRTGQSWAMQTIVLRTNERYPRNVAFTLSGEEKIGLANFKLGEQLTLDGYPESHEFNGSWYTELRVTDVRVGNTSRLQVLPAVQQ